MTIIQKTIIDQTEVTPNGIVQIRFALLTLKDGVEIGRTLHRSCVPPGVDVDTVIAAVNADITTRPSLMAEPVTVEDIPQLKAIASVVHTDQVVQAFQAQQVAAQEEMAASLAAVREIEITPPTPMPVQLGKVD